MKECLNSKTEMRPYGLRCTAINGRNCPHLVIPRIYEGQDYSKGRFSFIGWCDLDETPLFANQDFKIPKQW